MAALRGILHFHKLFHHHALLVAETDHIEAGREVGDVELGDTLVAFAGKHHHARDVGDCNRALQVVRALELHVEGVAGGVGIEFHRHVGIMGRIARLPCTGETADVPCRGEVLVIIANAEEEAEHTAGHHRGAARAGVGDALQLCNLRR